MQPFPDSTVNTPAFLGKLWKMVNDPDTDHLICWSSVGNSFIIQNQAQFWYELLPLYYKHNNMSSFVRQLNMYGFHKMSTVENGTMDSDKDEIQFTHPYFQRDMPELLKNIKRKTTTAKVLNENMAKPDDLAKVLTDVKQLRGRQATVDSQLSAMKQENALLWREVAILRQKHIKQQKIVNKLIQFLVTLVQPSRMTVGVKRGYQLMLNENPVKKNKGSSSKDSGNAEGPTIHELDNELELSPNLYEIEPMIQSPAKSTSQHNSPLQNVLSTDEDIENQDTVWDKPDIVPLDLHSISEPDPMLTTTSLSGGTSAEIFLNSSAQNALISNLEKSNSTNTDKTKKNVNVKKSNQNIMVNTNMTVATRDNILGDMIKSMPSTSDTYSGDLTSHVEATQSELEQLKDILNGLNYTSGIDTNMLLGELNQLMPHSNSDVDLFNDPDSHAYDLNNDLNNTNFSNETGDPMVSGSELTPYGTSFDFNELLDDSLDGESTTEPARNEDLSTSINTPQVIKEEPRFPTIQKK